MDDMDEGSGMDNMDIMDRMDNMDALMDKLPSKTTKKQFKTNEKR